MKGTYVLDSYALIGMFLGEKFADEVAKLLIDANESKITLSMSSINIGEVYYMVQRKRNETMPELILNKMLNFPIEIVVPNLELTLEAAKLKASFPLSYADAHTATLAIRLGAVLITGDREFASLKGVNGLKVRILVK